MTKQSLSFRAPGAQACYDRALRALHQGNRLEAIDQYRRSLVWSPNDAGIHYLIGTLTYLESFYDEAIEAYSAAVRLTPDHAQAHLGLANAFCRTADYGRSVESCQQALALEPDSEDLNWKAGKIYLAVAFALLITIL